MAVKLNQHDAKFGEVFSNKKASPLVVMVVGRKLLGNLEIDYLCVLLVSAIERPPIMPWGLFKDQWERVDG